MKNKMIAKIFAGVMAASLMMFAAGCAKQTESTVAGESTIVESVEESTEASEETEAEASEDFVLGGTVNGKSVASVRLTELSDDVEKEFLCTRRR